MSKFKLLCSEVDYLSKLVSGMTDLSYFSAKLQVLKIMLREPACFPLTKQGWNLVFVFAC